MRKIMSAMTLLLYMPLSYTNVVASTIENNYKDYNYSLKLSGGLTAKNLSSVKNVFTTTPSNALNNTVAGYNFGLAIGSNLLSNYLSTEIEGKYFSKNSCLIESKISSSTNNTTTDESIVFDNSIMTMMLKGNIRVVNFLVLSVYFTGGIGGLYSNPDLTPVRNRLSQITGITDLDNLKNQLGNDSNPLFEERSFWQNIYPAYVFGGGISFGLGESVSLELEYNYMGVLFSNNIDIPSTKLSSINMNKLSIAHAINAHVLSLGVRINL